MLAIERRSQILSGLESEKSVLVSDLSRKFGVTEETIRRDLEKLEKEGLAKKTYGGAVLAEGLSAEPSFRMREKTNIAQKLIIAEKIFNLVDPKDNIMMDASSTCVLAAKKLKNKDGLTIITNSVEILMECAVSDTVSLMSTGGSLRGSSLSLVGHSAADFMERFTVDKAIISCKGLDFSKGVTESSIAEAEIKKAMADNAKQVILAVDSSKFDRLSFAKSLDFGMVHCVVSDKIPAQWIDFFDKNNIEYL